MSRLTFNPEVRLLKRYASAARLGVIEIGVFDGETAELCAVGYPRFIERVDTVQVFQK